MTITIPFELRQFMMNTRDVAPEIKDLGFCVIRDETPERAYTELVEIDKEYHEVMHSHMMAFIETRPKL